MRWFGRRWKDGLWRFGVKIFVGNLELESLRGDGRLE